MEISKLKRRTKNEKAKTNINKNNSLWCLLSFNCGVGGGVCIERWGGVLEVVVLFFIFVALTVSIMQTEIYKSLKGKRVFIPKRCLL